jgi:hypothetical protein
MAGSYTIDESGFPLIIATFRGPATPERTAAYFARLDVWFRRNQRFATILDLAGGDMPTPAHRKVIAEHLAPRQVALAKRCIGLAVVISSSLVRGAVTAVAWLQPPAYPLEIVANLEEARVVCARWLAREEAPSRSLR